MADRRENQTKRGGGALLRRATKKTITALFSEREGGKVGVPKKLSH